MKSKYQGRCTCGAGFPRGAEIEYSRVQRRVIACPACKDKSGSAEPDLARMVDIAYEDQCRDMCGL